MAGKKSKAIAGSSYADRFILDASNSTAKKVLGHSGDDSFSTRGKVAFNLSLYGGDGNDKFDSGSAVSDFQGNKGAFQKNAVRMYGDAGNDRIIDSLGGSHVLSGGEGDDVIAYHINGGRFYGFNKPKLLVDGGPGNDRISYFNFPLAKGIVRGGDGDDLIGIGGKSGGGGIRYFGDNGDDVFNLRMMTDEKDMIIDGGHGFDEIYISHELQNRLVRIKEASGFTLMTFAYWQKNGITHESTITLKDIEHIGAARDFVPYKWGEYVNSTGGEIYSLYGTNQPYSQGAGSGMGVVSEYWNDNNGFSRFG